MADDSILEITDDAFDTLVGQSDVLVLVDFWAPWCVPCKRVSPILEELATQYAGKIRVGKVNIDENQRMAAQLGIRGIPAIFLFRGGEPVDSLSGVQPKSAYEQMIDRHL